MTTLLEQGIIALKQGDKTQAKYFFEQVLQADDKNERAWLWLSETEESPAEQIRCIERVLTINPRNATARRALQTLRGRQAAVAETPTPARGLLKNGARSERKPFRLQPEDASAGEGRVALPVRPQPRRQSDSLPLMPALIFGTLSVTAVVGVLMLLAFIFLT